MTITEQTSEPAELDEQTEQDEQSELRDRLADLSGRVDDLKGELEGINNEIEDLEGEHMFDEDDNDLTEVAHASRNAREAIRALTEALDEQINRSAHQ